MAKTPKKEPTRPPGWMDLIPGIGGARRIDDVTSALKKVTPKPPKKPKKPAGAL